MWDSARNTNENAFPYNKNNRHKNNRERLRRITEFVFAVKTFTETMQTLLWNFIEIQTSIFYKSEKQLQSHKYVVW